MTTKCLLVCGNSVMVAGVQAHLAQQTDLIVDTIDANIEAELATAIEIQRPDTVIVDEAVLMALSPQLRQLLRRLPDMQVVIFNQNNNLLHVYLRGVSQEAHARDLGQIVCTYQSPS